MSWKYGLNILEKIGKATQWSVRKMLPHYRKKMRVEEGGEDTEALIPPEKVSKPADVAQKKLYTPSYETPKSRLGYKFVRPRAPDRIPDESFWVIFFQVLFPFLIAGLGMVAAGLVLDTVQHWDVFNAISEIYILIPALLGLKGNLEMTLASRLSTMANTKRLETDSEIKSAIVANLSLILCQANVVGLLTTIVAITFAWIPEGKMNLEHALLLCASSLSTAGIASLILGILMIFVIIWSKRLNINPDNVATPIAASLGDLFTLSLLAIIATYLFHKMEHNIWISVIIIAICLILTPLWAYIASYDENTKEVLINGWTPVISAMVISSIGGFILNATVKKFKGVAVYQPVMNGVGGNLVAVQASRISTELHCISARDLRDLTVPIKPNIIFFEKRGHAKTARALLLMVVPGHLIFSFAINLLQAGHTSMTPIFLCVYLTAALIQVIILLYVAHVLCYWMCCRKIDPDNYAIPYLTALGDLLGTGLLALAFLYLSYIGDGDSDLGD